MNSGRFAPLVPIQFEIATLPDDILGGGEGDPARRGDEGRPERGTVRSTVCPPVVRRNNVARSPRALKTFSQLEMEGVAQASPHGREPREKEENTKLRAREQRGSQ
jgi:hypothetical protein